MKKRFNALRLVIKPTVQIKTGLWLVIFYTVLLTPKFCLAEVEPVSITSQELANRVDISAACQLNIDSSLAEIDGQLLRARMFKELNSFDFQNQNFVKPNRDYWIRTTLVNQESSIQRFLISIGDYYTTRLIVFSARQVEYEKTSGQYLRPSQRPYRYDYQYYPISIRPKDTLELYILFNADINNKSMLDPHIIGYEAEAQSKLKALYDDYYPMAINQALIGILFFMGFFILSQYLLTREKFMFFYSLYLFTMMLYAVYGFSHSPYIVHFLSFSHFLKYTLH